MLTVAILAGGLATRLRPITETVPKSLLEVNGEPFVIHQLRLLHTKGIRRVVLCVGHLGELIQSVIGDGSSFGLQVDSLVRWAGFFIGNCRRHQKCFTKVR